MQRNIPALFYLSVSDPHMQLQTLEDFWDQSSICGSDEPGPPRTGEAGHSHQVMNSSIPLAGPSVLVCYVLVYGSWFKILFNYSNLICLGWGAVFGLFQTRSFYLSRKSRQRMAGRTGKLSQPFQYKAMYKFNVEALQTLRAGVLLKKRATQACSPLKMRHMINCGFFSQ